MNHTDTEDVIIVGGSYAGLSAAMALGRSMRKVLIIDGGMPCNRQTPQSHNFLTQDGVKPNEIAALGKEQVLKYKTVTFYEDFVVTGRKTESGFEIETQSGQLFQAKKLVLAAGLKDHMPEIEGFAECWGTSVVHCPYCHGYEFHHQPTAILADGEMAWHYAQLIDNLTKELTILTNGKSSLTTEQIEGLQRHNIAVVENEIDYLKHDNGHLKQVIFKDGSTHALNALYARPLYEQHCKVAEQLGCKFNEQDLIEVNPFQKTTVAGVFAAGDCTAFRSVAMAVATGNMAGATCNKELIEDSF